MFKYMINSHANSGVSLCQSVPANKCIDSLQVNTKLKQIRKSTQFLDGLDLDSAVKVFFNDLHTCNHVL